MFQLAARISFVGLAAALPAVASAQMAIGLGAGVVYGPVLAPAPVYGLYAPVVVVPYPLYGYGGAGFIYPPPRTDGLPSCYRAGRCTLADLYALGGRPDRLDRLAPTAPDLPPAGHALDRPPNVPPTAVDEIQPAYRGASVPRDEFRQSGAPR
ncbi:MAG TPA: hypothetical protein VML91_09020 [Burkholderiales bacterium]|nr:hypothetical protein [Burkholderiales bacterium]